MCRFPAGWGQMEAPVADAGSLKHLVVEKKVKGPWVQKRVRQAEFVQGRRLEIAFWGHC